jgi:hypothetical protein
MEESVKNSAGKSPNANACNIKCWAAIAAAMAEHDSILWFG